MINIKKKTPKEIEEERALNSYAAVLVKGREKKVCTTYLMKNDGTKVDISDLNEQEIMWLIANDLKDLSNPNGTYKTNPNGPGCFELADALKQECNYHPSFNAAIQLLQMKEVYGHTVDDLIGTIRADEKIIPAETIARFIKESNGDFTPLQTQEIIGVLKQMSYNEQMKEKQSFKKR